MRVCYMFLLALLALLTLSSEVVNAQVIWGEGVPTLVSGRSWTDSAGLVHYVTYAEERAPVSPMIWEIRNRFNRKLQTNDVLIYPPKEPKRVIRYKQNISYTHTETYSDTFTPINHTTKTASHVRYSTMSWWVTDRPRGALVIEGTREIESNDQYQFVIPNAVFPLAGVYNLHYNVSMYYGYNLIWNRTLTVNKQPQTLVLTTSPEGFNGTALSPSARVEFRDFFESVIRTDTAVTTLNVLSSPIGATFTGSMSQRATNGISTFAGVVPSLPGTYVFRLDAKLSDSSTLSTPSFQVVVQKALPVSIGVVRTPVALARFAFMTQPLYQLRDARGLVQDPRTNITLSLFLNQPSIGYEGLPTLGELSGKKDALPVDYLYSYSGLSIDLPGRYEIEATLYLDGEPFLNNVIGFNVADPPTWEVPEGLTVNTQGIITVYGSRPANALITLKMSRELECTSFASNIVTWPVEQTFVSVRNITFTPFANGAVYLCMRIPDSQSTYVPLLQHYLPSFRELYPLLYTFTITDVASCLEVGAELALRYRAAGWDTAQAGRSYGCRLSPPVSGTIPPCTCATILSCTAFAHSSFEPPGLDIGRCVCCKDWVMALAGVCTTLFLLALLFVIYMWA